MISTYVRSSSYGTYSLCQFQFYLDYILGIKSKPNYKTEKGSIVHKALELLAHRKLAEQNGLVGFSEDEIGRELWAEDITIENAVDLAWRHYTYKNECGHNWGPSEYVDCLGWTRDVCELSDGIFSPLNRTVIRPEQYFDLTIEEPWAWYDFQDPFTGKRIQGYLAIKGTVDLLTEVSPLVLECLDWKSGQQKDWATNKPKDFDSLHDDFQLLLYFYALCRLYPQYPYIFITIFFAQTKNPYTMPFDRERDMPRLLEMIRTRFTELRNNHNPKRIKDDNVNSWKCTSFCWYGKTKPDGVSKCGKGEVSLCDQINSEVQELGIERVMLKRGRASAYSSYGSGGGVTNRE